MPMRLLCLSNGHGEDQIAVRLLQQLQTQSPLWHLAVLPLVGTGRAYEGGPFERIGPSKAMPSGGFIYMDGKQLARDVRGGLLNLTRQQLQAVRQWGHSAQQAQEPALVLAVGDIVPLVFAWLSGQPYAFVGTAKSEYYLRDEQGPLARQGRRAQLESLSPSIYLPWERWLMGRPRCKGVFPRDRLTCEILKRGSIPAFDLGNPMMDGLALPPHVSPMEEELGRGWRVLLLPGSRPPEVYGNWELILEAVKTWVNGERERSLTFWAAISPGLDCQPLVDTLKIQAWQSLVSPEASPENRSSGSSIAGWQPGAETLVFGRRQHRLVLSQQHFAEFLQGADLAIAMAGTATEQFVGLGKPAFILPGSGPQFTPAFAEAQTRLLGPSVILVPQASRLPGVAEAIMADPERLRQIAENGLRRMGAPGAAARIAAQLLRLTV